MDQYRVDQRGHRRPSSARRLSWGPGFSVDFAASGLAAAWWRVSTRPFLDGHVSLQLSVGCGV